MSCAWWGLTSICWPRALPRMPGCCSPPSCASSSPISATRSSPRRRWPPPASAFPGCCPRTCAPSWPRSPRRSRCRSRSTACSGPWRRRPPGWGCSPAAIWAARCAPSSPRRGSRSRPRRWPPCPPRWGSSTSLCPTRTRSWWRPSTPSLDGSMIGAPVAVSEQVAELHRQALVIDLHNDLLTKISHVSYDLAARHRPAAFWNPLRLDLDLPKIRAGGIDALGCALFAGFRVGAPRRFWRQLERAAALVAQHPDQLALIDSAAGLRGARAAGRTGLFLGVEGSYVVDQDLDPSLDRLARAGVRYLGPLWE